jgi:transposase
MSSRQFSDSSLCTFDPMIQDFKAVPKTAILNAHEKCGNAKICRDPCSVEKYFSVKVYNRYLSGQRSVEAVSVCYSSVTRILDTSISSYSSYISSQQLSPSDKV